jgi:16S rRNA processing protein RimM
MSDAPAEPIVVGRIVGVYGVKGWVKVHSYTEAREDILNYDPWLLRAGGAWRPAKLAEGRPHGKGIVARLAGCEDCEGAAALVGTDVAIGREQLAPAAPGEYYWADLIGLRVATVAGQDLGVIDHLLETGANDVLVVQGERERLIPYLQGEVVIEVDLEHRVMRVDWDPDF